LFRIQKEGLVKKDIFNLPCLSFG